MAILPDSAAAAASRLASSTLVASGFSTKTFLPASSISHRHRGVQMVGGGDADPVDVGRGHLGGVVRPRDTEVLAHLACPRPVGVADQGELAAVVVGVRQGVVLAPDPEAYHGDFRHGTHGVPASFPDRGPGGPLVGLERVNTAGGERRRKGGRRLVQRPSPLLLQAVGQREAGQAGAAQIGSRRAGRRSPAGRPAPWSGRTSPGGVTAEPVPPRVVGKQVVRARRARRRRPGRRSSPGARPARRSGGSTGCRSAAVCHCRLSRSVQMPGSSTGIIGATVLAIMSTDSRWFHRAARARAVRAQTSSTTVVPFGRCPCDQSGRVR